VVREDVDIGESGAKDSRPQVHIVQAFSSNRSNQPLAEGMCLRCPDRRFDGGNPEVLDRPVEPRGGMSIVDEEAIGVVARNGFAKLLQSPIRRGMLGHSAVADFASFAILYAKFRGEKKRARDILDKLREKQHEILRAEEPIVAALERWLMDFKNHGRLVNSQQLNGELFSIAWGCSIEWPYKTPNSLEVRGCHI
jgi:hypothetical protein